MTWGKRCRRWILASSRRQRRAAAINSQLKNVWFKQCTRHLTTPSGSNIADKVVPQTLLLPYYFLEDGEPVRHSTIPTAKPSWGATSRAPRVESHLHIALGSVLITSMIERPRRCFACVGKSLSPVSDDASTDDLLNESYTISDLSKHFRRRRLACSQGDSQVYGLVCRVGGCSPELGWENRCGVIL